LEKGKGFGGEGISESEGTEIGVSEAEMGGELFWGFTKLLCGEKQEFA